MPRRRLARGEKRIAQLLDAAAEEFAAVGYASATTNSIAARAGASPGTLYQFFPNKEAMARALTERYRSRLRAVFAFVRDPALDRMPVGELVERVVDPVLALSRASPAFGSLFAGTAPPTGVTAVAATLDAGAGRVMEAVIGAAAPHLTAANRRRCAKVVVHIVKAMLSALEGATAGEQARLAAEFKTVLNGYLSGLAAVSDTRA
ncbi:putative TetR family transcriptional regulator [Actinacidiphila reveromycinica]|uniref:Putative TetR family transcriptional regulator n=1 Tax=Actinacidiphila reveromycinica TaxID=659352 RepID=A0A7U3UY76_9ACTN|nr:putative TetR family transcriptional regulator [Streptomyces sp. SN-593]